MTEAGLHLPTYNTFQLAEEKYGADIKIVDEDIFKGVNETAFSSSLLSFKQQFTRVSLHKSSSVFPLA